MAVKTWLRTQLQGFSSEKPLLFARFLRKLPALWRQELAMAEHQGSHANRIFIRGDGGCYPIYAAEDTSSDEGSYIEQESTGERMWLQEEGGLYVLRTKVAPTYKQTSRIKNQGFAWQATPP